MNTKESERRIEYIKRQFEIHKSQAAYWGAMATTGVATIRNLQRGRKSTLEEVEKGMSVGWEPMTDQEKIKEALETMDRHIHLMHECNDAINDLMSDDVRDPRPWDKF